MEDDNAGPAPSPELLYLGQNSTTRLLEVYVKRSLSLNDTCARRQRVKKTRKWVIVDSKGTRIRKASSDSSTHRLSQQSNTDQPKEPSKDTVRGSKTQEIKRKVTRKPSILRSFLSLFSRKTNEVAIAPVPESPGSSGSNDSCFTSDPCPAPVPEKVHEEKDRAIPHRAKSIKKKLSLKKLSFRNHDADKSDSVRRQTSLATADVVRVKDAIVCVEPSTVYFEKVSEELERIVKEVKESPVEEHEDLSPAALTEEQPSEVVTDSPEDIIERMVAILKQEGDVIDAKIRRNNSLSSYFQSLNYNSFKQLADRYVAAIPDPLPQSTEAPPQLVKLAFTLDFTAKVAGLSNQAVSRVMGFGNKYIQDRFTQITSGNHQELASQNAEDLSLVDPD